MSYWDYRVMEFTGTLFAIHEVHYDNDGKAVSYTARPAVVAGDDVSYILAKMTDALVKPTLKASDFTNGG